MNRLLLLAIFSFNTFVVLPQQKTRPVIRVVFYNVENFYDWMDDPTTNDEEFLPESSHRWTKYRFEDKANKLSKVFTTIGELEFPDIIGMAEVENAFVIKYLIQQTPMQKVPLGFVHSDSKDPRGIDACILYRTDKLKLVNKELIKVHQKNGNIQLTRDIVYASFQTKEKETLHVFVNHWSSRRGGELESQAKRNRIALLLRQKTDSLLKFNPSAKIIIIGDFNDEPYNASIAKILKAQMPGKEISTSDLYNLSSQFMKTFGTGTLKYRGKWSIFDQVIVSGALLGKNGISTCNQCAGVYNKQFLLAEDKTHMGYMPWRTFEGLKYSGGFSDHLPIYLNLHLNISVKK